MKTLLGWYEPHQAEPLATALPKHPKLTKNGSKFHQRLFDPILRLPRTFLKTVTELRRLFQLPTWQVFRWIKLFHLVQKNRLSATNLRALGSVALYIACSPAYSVYLPILN